MEGSERGAARTIKVRISAAWIKCREISRLLKNKHISLKHRANEAGEDNDKLRPENVEMYDWIYVEGNGWK